MKSIVIIPSRYGSSRFPGKPLAEIDGKPMVQRVYETVAQSPLVSKVYVATDDNRIYTAVKSFGANAVYTSSNNRTGTDRVAEAVELLRIPSDYLIVNIQGDQPLLEPACVEEVLRPFQEQNLEMTTLAIAIADSGEYTNPKDVKVVRDRFGFALYFSRSPIPFAQNGKTPGAYKHLGVYAYTTRFLTVFRALETGNLETIESLEQLRALEHGYKIYVALTDHDSPEVDIPEDIPRIEKIVKKQTL